MWFKNSWRTTEKPRKLVRLLSRHSPHSKIHGTWQPHCVSPVQCNTILPMRPVMRHLSHNRLTTILMIISTYKHVRWPYVPKAEAFSYFVYTLGSAIGGFMILLVPFPHGQLTSIHFWASWNAGSGVGSGCSLWSWFFGLWSAPGLAIAYSQQRMSFATRYYG